MDTSALATGLAATWPIWFVSVVLVVAAVIDGIQLKVPNWLTYPFVIAGWIYSVSSYGWEGLGWTMLGTVVGLLLLLPAYSIGGMGAGDVKLMMGIGAWVHVSTTFYAFFLATTVVGAVLTVLMVLARRAWKKHYMQFWSILAEILVIKNPEQLSTIAAERKSTMLLLPYGIPMAIGTIGYFAWMGMFL